MAEPTTSVTKASGKPERTRTSDSRIEGSRPSSAAGQASTPAAGAHAADHLLNQDATPGAGALPSHAHASGREVDGAAG